MAFIASRTFPSPSQSTLSSDSNPFHYKFTVANPRFTSPLKQSIPLSQSISRFSTPTICRCQNDNSLSPSNKSSGDNRGWDYFIQEVVGNWIKKFGRYVNSYKDLKNEAFLSVGIGERESEVAEIEDEDWDWDRWKKHFSEIDEQQHIVSVLKSQLTRAVTRENYEDAARLKVAIAAATTNDTVGTVMSHLSKAIEEEHYEDAAFIRDYANAGLVGWWAGVSADGKDPYGQIIHIGAEHGRYVARSYSPRQLATGRNGAPLFEIYLTMSKKGEYKEQAVYLKRWLVPQDFPIMSSKSFGPTMNLNPLDPTADEVDLIKKAIEDKEDDEEGDDDSDIAEGSGFENILRDMIPGVKVKVLKVTAPGKVDRDLISKVVEQIMEEEDEDKDTELESLDAENDDNGESDKEQNEIAIDSGGRITEGEEQSQIAVKVVVGGLVQKVSGTSRKDLLRVPARLEKKGRLSFRFTVQEDDNQQISGGNVQSPPNKKTKLQGRRSIDHVMLDLVKSIGKGKIPMKVLKDVGKLLTLTLSQAQNREPLSGSTTFNRIDIPASSDPLNGLYVGAHGLYTSEVIQIKRKFGHWQEDGGTKEHQNLEFYEYIEAVKLTGDPYVPAGQVAFRAKVGKKYQLPHKGIIPEEFGVVARYKGQGRLAEPGFQNPRWVDGEVVILDGKYIKGGPVIGGCNVNRLDTNSHCYCQSPLVCNKAHGVNTRKRSETSKAMLVRPTTYAGGWKAGDGTKVLDIFAFYQRETE